MIKAIIFDLGGVVIENGVYVAYQKWPEFEQTFKEKYLISAERGKISTRKLWKNLSLDLPQLKMKEIENYIFKNFVPIPEVFKIAKRLKENYKIALLTNNLAEWFSLLDKKYKLSKIFKNLIVSAKVGIRKPEREIYLLTASRLKVNPQECLFIDDLPENIEGARKAKMRTILFRGPTRLKEELKKLGIKL